ncbi:PREDICTED: probable WRKY transcription factor 50 isoform X2 [Nicotiana attenuata]|uniref:probable WRKY transcription factor 50 isoform X2 n=1 Tax=Nicotiana attenuata TaxID=49451 RepID=UPI0009058B63|nr:PREDICTED: probable WRKY transcription factor 50 isoform X2 [Nicotiana attenuata]
MEDFHYSNPNPNYGATGFIETPEFELSGYLFPEEGLSDDFLLQNEMTSEFVQSISSSGSYSNPTPSSTNNIKCTKGVNKKYNKVDAKSRVAFRFRSELEVLDDGFKWRKYGKKMVKNSPNPSFS